MSPSGFLILLISVTSCCAAPNPENDRCQKPKPIHGAQLQGEWNEETYPPGKVANFACLPDYTQDGPIKMACIEGIWWHIAKGQCKEKRQECPPAYSPKNMEIIDPKEAYYSNDAVTMKCDIGYKMNGSPTVRCIEGKWEQPPVCTKIGAQCGPPPVVQFGDTTKFPETSYKSGDSVEYKCLAYYILKGNKIVRCLNGVWDEAPACLEPCTAKEKDMNKNNIQLRWRNDVKLYSEHGDIVTFMCKSGYEAPPDTQTRIVCEQGKLEYPKCFKTGSCVLEQQTMITNNIHYNINTVVDHGQKITFECNKGMMPEDKLEAKCEWRKINYPKCTAANIECTIPDTSDLILSPHQSSYRIGSAVSFSCKEGFLRDGPLESVCTNEGWNPSSPTCKSITKYRCVIPWTNNLIRDPFKIIYRGNDEVSVICEEGFTQKGSSKITCTENGWDPPLPICEEIGEQCGPPPVVQFGDTTKFPETSYKSGDSVEYKCPAYYILKGNKIVRCFNGVWEEAPVCLEPCTAKEKDMEENNIQLRWRNDEKLYGEHGDSITFMCKSGYEAPPDTQMKIICEQGKLEYPKCFKRGSCVLEQQTMIINNIHYNISTVVDHGQRITFECKKGTMPEDKLESKCEWRKINYPKCTAAKICKSPEILNGFLRSEQQASYESGSYVDFQCNDGYVINGRINVKCESGQWTDLPVCLSPCKISTEDLTIHNIQLLPSADPKNILDSNHRHGTELSVTCKSGFRRPNYSALVIECYDGKFTYPRCFSGKTCRLDQDRLDENNLELDEVHNNEVYYEEGERIQFKCKNGFYHRNKPTGRCTEQTLSYPRCTAQSSV